MSLDATHTAAEQAARTSYGRLLALLAVRTRDIAAAEDALSEAFAAALRRWPETGVPDNPDAWLLVTARRAHGDRQRRDAVRDKHQAMLELLAEERIEDDPQTIPDERLKLMFACAHPAIDAAVRTPIMLQAVLGLDAARIGNAFLVQGPAMGQRLVRAKSKLKNAGVSFAIPEAADMPARLDDVLAAIYAAFNAAWDDMPGFSTGGQDLIGEAIYLCRVVTGALPDEPEPLGLLALMLYCEARRPARRAPDGSFIPLAEQDSRLWSRDMIIAAETCLTSAARHGRPGRFQTEAAIQSFHIQRPVNAQIPAAALLKLYDVLCGQTASLGAAVSRAVAYAEHDSAETALALLNDLPENKLTEYQPYWVARARILETCGTMDAAAAAYAHAIALTSDDNVRRFLDAARRRCV